MRKIFPEKQLPINMYNPNPVTQQDLAELQVHIDEVATNLSNLANNLAEYKITQATNTSTALLNAVRGVISTLEATSVAITDGTFQNITVENVANLKSIVADSLNLANTLSAESIISTNGRISNLEAVEATIGELNATTVNIQNWTADVIAANTVNAATKVATPLVEAEDVQADTVEVTDKLTAAEIETDLLDVNRLNISKGIEAGELKTSFITWKNSQLITNPSDDDYYLKIPQFKNGTIYLMGTVGGAPVWSIEITNSLENYYMSWSKKETDYLRRILFSKAGDVTTLYFHGGTYGQAIKIYYAIIAGANDGVPEYYEELPTTYTSEYIITYFNGHKYWNPVDLFNEGSAVGTLTLQPRNNYSAADPVSKQYDTSTDVNFTVYLPNQNLNTDANVEFNQVTTRWLGVKEFSTRNFIATSLETLSTLDLTDFDDGSLIVVRNTSTVETKSLSTAYLKYTDDQDQPILYQLVSISGAPAIRTNKPLVYNPTTKTIEEATDLNISGDAVIAGDLEVNGALAAASFSVDNNVVIAGNLEVKGDLTVDGIGEEIISTELRVGANTITLRNNNPTGLGNTELAGVVTENYDGNNHNNIIAIDKNGVARTGDIDIATRILYSNDGTNFYTDESLTIPATIGATEEVRDTGNQTSGGVEIYEGITYSNNDTQPLLTRAESNTFTNGHYLKWDATNKRAVDGGITIDMFYPIGSIYWTGKAPDDGGDPNVLFGGTWVQIKDKFILAAGDTYSNGDTGGSATVTLTTNEMPSHNHGGTTGNQSANPTFYWSGSHSHSVSYPRGYNSDQDANAIIQNASIFRYYAGLGTDSTTITVSGTTSGDHTHSIPAEGGDGAHENMPPYIVKYCWERTA